MTRPIDLIVKLMDSHEDHAAVIKNSWNTDMDEFFVGLDLATNPAVDFHISKVPALDEDDVEPGTLTFDQFYQLAMTLVHEFPGEILATQLIEEAALSSNAQEWNLWYRRILLKSLHKHLPMDAILGTIAHLTTE